jgi:hypothetical protein
MACASVYQDAGSAYVTKLPTPPINFQISKHAPGLNGRNRNLYAAWMIFFENLWFFGWVRRRWKILM